MHSNHPHQLPALTGYQGLSAADRRAAWGRLHQALPEMHFRPDLEGECGHHRWAWDLKTECWADASVPAVAEAFAVHQRTRAALWALGRALAATPTGLQTLPPEAGVATPRTPVGAVAQQPEAPHTQLAPAEPSTPPQATQLPLLCPSTGQAYATRFATLNAARALQGGLAACWRMTQAGCWAFDVGSGGPGGPPYVHQASSKSDAGNTRHFDGAFEFDGNSRPQTTVTHGTARPDGPCWPIRQNTLDCSTGRWAHFRCASGHGADVWCGGSHVAGPRSCEHCQEAVAHQRARRCWRRIGGIGAPWGVLVMTMPPEVRHHLHHPSQQKAWLAAAWAAVRDWAAVHLGAEGIGAIHWWHPVGEDDVTWHPHLNFLVPLVDTRTGKRLREHLPKTALDGLRAAWCRALSEITGEPCSVVDVHWSYRTGAAKKRHALRYFGRPFPAWSDWNPRTTWLGDLSTQTWRATRTRLEGWGHFAGGAQDCQAVCRECGGAMAMLFQSPVQDWATRHAHHHNAGVRVRP